MSRFYNFHYKENDAVIKIDQDAIVGDEHIPCTIEPDDHPGTGYYRINDLVVILRSAKVRDVSSTWHCNYIITDRVAALFKEQGFTGYKLRHVDVRFPQTNRFHGIIPPVLWELKVTGWGGVAPKASGIKPVTVCPGCCYTHYTSLLYPENLLDELQWDGSDFFFVWPLPKFIFVTERVKDFVRATRLKGVNIIPVEKMKLGKDGFSPGKLRYFMDRERAKKLGGHLGID